MEDDVVDRMCRSGAVDLICIDSVSALTPRAEIALKFFSSVRLEIRNWEDKIELCRLQVSVKNLILAGVMKAIQTS
ncbi:hypothetical protein ACS0TY_016287 [Phlomoides rotata]